MNSRLIALLSLSYVLIMSCGFIDKKPHSSVEQLGQRRVTHFCQSSDLVFLANDLRKLADNGIVYLDDVLSYLEYENETNWTMTDGLGSMGTTEMVYSSRVWEGVNILIKSSTRESTQREPGRNEVFSLDIILFSKSSPEKAVAMPIVVNSECIRPESLSHRTSPTAHP